MPLKYRHDTGALRFHEAHMGTPKRHGCMSKLQFGSGRRIMTLCTAGKAYVARAVPHVACLVPTVALRKSQPNSNSRPTHHRHHCAVNENNARKHRFFTGKTFAVRRKFYLLTVVAYVSTLYPLLAAIPFHKQSSGQAVSSDLTQARKQGNRDHQLFLWQSFLVKSRLPIRRH